MAWPVEASVTAVCRHWLGAAPDAVVPHGAAGLSGAPVFAVDHAGKRYVLKRFGEAATRVHAEWVHAVMRHARAAGIVEVPAVMLDPTGASVQADEAGSLWELIEWKAGVATATPSAAEVAAAAATLARVHLATATLPGHAPRAGDSPGTRRRIDQARRLLARPWAARTSQACPSMPSMQIRLHRAVAIVAAMDGRRGIAQMAAVVPGPVMVQPVLRDVWSDHVLFADARVTGIIDWHAAGIDTPATDIARLLGSWWHVRGVEQTFFSAYENVRLLGDRDRGMVAWLQASGVVCAVDNWLRWTLEEQRRFVDVEKVEQRVDRLLESLPAALDRLAHAGRDVPW